MSASAEHRDGLDRRIVALALPALGALAAEPLYVLVDTAIVGHLGDAPLAALALAGTVLAGAVTLCNFLAYGSTPQVGRLHASGRHAEAASIGRQAILLAVVIGVALCLLCLLGAGLAVSALGGHGEFGRLAALYLRIAGLGLPFALIAVAGQGYLRGVSRLRLPFVLILAGNVLNALLEVLFVYGLHWGIAGSAWATAIAQALTAIAFLRAIAAGAPSPAGEATAAGAGGGWRLRLSIVGPMLRSGGQIFVRTGSLYAAFVLAGAILAHAGATSLDAHQVAFQLWLFLALTLDALAIAAQVLISQALGAGRPELARKAAARIVLWSVAGGCLLALAMLALSGPLPQVFTSSPAVLAKVHEIWLIFALMQPVNGAVFALDGILLGAGDTRYLMWAMLGSTALAFLPLALATALLGWGIVGIWLAILALVLARLAGCGARLMGEAWTVAGHPGAIAADQSGDDEQRPEPALP